MIALSDISVRAGGALILDQVSVGFEPGRLHAILGPNGAGKSTLMKVATGLARPANGRIEIDGRAPDAFPPAELARKRAVLSQNLEVAFPLSAEAVAAMGRYPHYRHTPSPADREIVARAIELVGMTPRRAQAYATLSGGERQKVQLARVLAQIWPAESEETQGRWLFLDEPTAGLDIRHQLQILQTARGMLGQGCTVIAVLHDLNLALEYADHLVLMSAGRLAWEGDAKTPLTPTLIEQVFAVQAKRAGQGWRFSL